MNWPAVLTQIVDSAATVDSAELVEDLKLGQRVAAAQVLQDFLALTLFVHL